MNKDQFYKNILKDLNIERKQNINKGKDILFLIGMTYTPFCKRVNALVNGCTPSILTRFLFRNLCVDACSENFNIESIDEWIIVELGEYRMQKDGFQLKSIPDERL